MAYLHGQKTGCSVLLHPDDTERAKILATVENGVLEIQLPAGLEGFTITQTTLRTIITARIEEKS